MTRSQLNLACFTLGDWMTNCYVVHPAGQNACWIVDAGFEPTALLDYVRVKQLTPEAVILTHAHVDHIAGLTEVREAWPEVEILIHEDEAAFLTEPMLNLSIILEEPIIAPPATARLAQGQVMSLAGVSFEVRHTPGHSPGGISLYQPDHAIALVGDALFAGSIGRTNFPTSNHAALIRSVREQLLTLPDNTRVLSGHGPETTIGTERRTNPFVGEER